MLDLFMRIDSPFIMLVIMAMSSFIIIRPLDQKVKEVQFLRRSIISGGLIIVFLILEIICNHFKLYSLQSIFIGVVFITEAFTICYSIGYNAEKIRNKDKDKPVNKHMLFSLAYIVTGMVLVNVFTNAFFYVNDEGKRIANSLYLCIPFIKPFYYIMSKFLIKYEYRSLNRFEFTVFSVLLIVSAMVIYFEAVDINNINVLTIYAVNLALASVFFKSKYTVYDISTKLSTYTAFEDKLHDKYVSGENYALILFKLDDFEEILSEKSVMQSDKVAKKFGSILKRVVQNFKILDVALFERDKFFILVDESNEDKINELLLIIESNIKTENMNALSESNINCTYVYDIVKNDKYRDYTQQIRHLFVELANYDINKENQPYPEIEV